MYYDLMLHVTLLYSRTKLSYPLLRLQVLPRTVPPYFTVFWIILFAEIFVRCDFQYARLADWLLQSIL